jgi:DNA polymerase IIIc chi subunit
MKIEINFYQVNNIVENGVAKSIAPLLLKILEENKRALIYSNDTDLINSLDNGLWSFGKNKFIPHVTIFDKEFEQKKQPIFITNQEENCNQADYLILLDKVAPKFISNFSRIFYFYDDSQAALIKNIAASYQEITDNFNFYKKDLNSQKWISVSL